MSFLRDTWIVFLRQLRPTLHAPLLGLGFSMLQPVLYLVLFAPLLSGMPGAMGDNSLQWFVPGVLAMLGLFGTAFAGFGLLPEIRGGAHERMLATPASRVALLLGRVLRDVAVLLVQSVVILLAVLPFGLEVSLPGAAAGLALLMVLGTGLGTLSYLLAMTLREESMFAAALQTMIMPLILLSGVMLPMDLAPAWLYALSRANPVSHVVDAERALFAGDFGDVSVLAGTGVAVAIAAVALAAGTRMMRRLAV
ncbi:ABC transporter permease [Streptomonospora nanhaiensis]|uniref:Transport permease protein n=1 Tax=Streptomonospora nanhaiensis TaxID=1323731 RepID=A0A853BWA4_9ACTN|nr:ABC transporter permease [Streptomonospora nanhaiensis]MBV2363711.1 ABC transporter permease [Streptomonospora nanhaiensis]MBX9391418.1 ABC transporter permease [Streptomonospora nanhaiensis]NYI98757.1 ABC-2 type transport system permease protein [Streptomonospora nanhaiensis]